MPNSPAEQEPPREEPGNPAHAESAASMTRKPRETTTGRHSWNTPARQWKNTPSWAGSSPSRKGGAVSRGPRDLRRTFQAGWTKEIGLAAEDDRLHCFDEKDLQPTSAIRTVGPTEIVPLSTKPWRQGQKPLPDCNWGRTWNSSAYAPGTGLERPWSGPPFAR